MRHSLQHTPINPTRRADSRTPYHFYITDRVNNVTETLFCSLKEANEEARRWSETRKVPLFRIELKRA